MPKDQNLISLPIEALGGLGDGIGYYKGDPVYVPFAMPGDELRVRLEGKRRKRWHAQLEDILTPSPQRVTAACTHYMQCGGCALQHLPETDYYALKRQLLVESIARAGYSTEAVQEPIRVGAKQRRRISLKVKASRRQVTLGLYAPHSHQLIPLSMCPVLEPELEALLSPLQELISQFQKPRHVQEVQLSRVQGSIEVRLLLSGELGYVDRKLFSRFIFQQQLARGVGSARGQDRVVVEREPLQIKYPQTTVDVPPGAFLQATQQGEQALQEGVLAGTANANRVVDLYSGCGTYTFPLAASGKEVLAIEGSASMVAALHQGILRGELGEQIEVQQRDLYEAPLPAETLSDFDAIVINPPRQGATPQMREIAKSQVASVVLVSCNPRSLERDLKYLQEAGYRLKQATPVDQFYWTPHLEAIVVLTR